LGGVLTARFGWRLAVASIVPAGLLVASLGLAILDRPWRLRDIERLGLLPALLLTLSVGGLLFLIHQFAAHGWRNWGFGLVAVLSLACVLWFFLFETRATFLRRDLLTDRRIFAPNLAGLYLVAAGDAVLFLVTLHMQIQLGFTSTKASVFFAVFGLASLVGGFVAGPLITRAGARHALIFALGIQSGAILGLVPFPNDAVSLLLGLTGFGAGNMAALVAIGHLTIAAAPIGGRGSAAAILQTSQQFGAALGVTVISAATIGGRDNLRLGLLLAVGLTLCGLATYAALDGKHRATLDSE
jgi:predicted MFS family arabinose efflux permease